MFSLKQAHNVQHEHRYELCRGAKSVAGSGLDIRALTWSGCRQFLWDPEALSSLQGSEQKSFAHLRASAAF